METNLQIRATGKMVSRGECYEILLGDEVIASGTSPECAACRVLKNRGITGTALFWRVGKAHADLRMGIDWGAAHYVSETAKTGIRFAKWEPNPLFTSELEPEHAE